MSRVFAPRRPGNWAERSWRRVAFFAHANEVGHLSTILMQRRAEEYGIQWPKSGSDDPGILPWLSFPVVPPAHSGADPVWCDFYVVMDNASMFLRRALNRGDDTAYQWVEAGALAALAEAQADGVPLTIGWGAYTKVATNHGVRFLERHPDLQDQLSTTHGDAGPVGLLRQAIRLAGVAPGFRVSVLGAYGAIGAVVSRALVALEAGSITLVGKKDKDGETKNWQRLERLAMSVSGLVPRHQTTEVLIHQDSTMVCKDHQSQLVIVATSGSPMLPEHVLPGTLILDLTTPAACQPNHNWQDRLVLTTGCGEFDSSVITRDFGVIARERILDVGAGGPRIIWGCKGEAITRSAFGWHGHLVGQAFPLEEVDWCDRHCALIGLRPQPPVSFDTPVSHREVREFVARNRDN